MLYIIVVASIVLCFLCCTSPFLIPRSPPLCKGGIHTAATFHRSLVKLKCTNAAQCVELEQYKLFSKNDNTTEVAYAPQLSNTAGKVKPGELLATYGVAYLATSISFAIVSYTLCFMLVSHGIDVSAVLTRVGIRPTPAASNAGTAAIAYAMHKAASPIRFPPTVLLTPVTARWIFGKKLPNTTIS